MPDEQKKKPERAYAGPERQETDEPNFDTIETCLDYLDERAKGNTDKEFEECLAALRAHCIALGFESSQLRDFRDSVEPIFIDVRRVLGAKPKESTVDAAKRAMDKLDPGKAGRSGG